MASREQAIGALRYANECRVHQADLCRRVGREGMLAAVQILRSYEPDYRVRGGVKIGALLMAIRGYGSARVTKLLQEVGTMRMLRLEHRLDELTARERYAIADELEARQLARMAAA